MRRIDGISYAPEHGFRGLGDLYLPAQPEGAPAALVIHGGGWNAMDKSGLAGIAELLCEQGYGAFNVNYRLLDQAPWPACGDDCLRAARYLLDGGHPSMAPLNRSKILIAGASAGGHLALMTGLRLPPAQVRAIVCMAGPADLVLSGESKGLQRFAKFLGVPNEQAVTAEALRAASPIGLVTSQAPPLLCIHSVNDQLVVPEQSLRISKAWIEAGVPAELFSYRGPGEQHGFWDPETADPRRLLPEPAAALAAFARRMAR